MCHARERSELVTDLLTKIQGLKDVCFPGNPEKGILKQRMKRLRISIRKFETDHFRRINEEDNIQIKKDLKVEFLELLAKADDAYFPSDPLLNDLNLVMASIDDDIRAEETNSDKDCEETEEDDFEMGKAGPKPDETIGIWSSSASCASCDGNDEENVASKDSSINVTALEDEDYDEKTKDFLENDWDQERARPRRQNNEEKSDKHNADIDLSPNSDFIGEIKNEAKLEDPTELQQKRTTSSDLFLSREEFTNTMEEKDCDVCLNHEDFVKTNNVDSNSRKLEPEKSLQVFLIEPMESCLPSPQDDEKLHCWFFLPAPDEEIRVVEICFPPPIIEKGSSKYFSLPAPPDDTGGFESFLRVLNKRLGFMEYIFLLLPSYWEKEFDGKLFNCEPEIENIMFAMFPVPSSEIEKESWFLLKAPDEKEFGLVEFIVLSVDQEGAIFQFFVPASNNMKLGFMVFILHSRHDEGNGVIWFFPTKQNKELGFVESFVSVSLDVENMIFKFFCLARNNEEYDNVKLVGSSPPDEKKRGWLQFILQTLDKKEIGIIEFFDASLLNNLFLNIPPEIKKNGFIVLEFFVSPCVDENVLFLIFLQPLDEKEFGYIVPSLVNEIGSLQLYFQVLEKEIVGLVEIVVFSP